MKIDDSLIEKFAKKISIIEIKIFISNNLDSFNKFKVELKDKRNFKERGDDDEA